MCGHAYTHVHTPARAAPLQECRPCQLLCRERWLCLQETSREPTGPWRGSSSSRCSSQVPSPRGKVSLPGYPAPSPCSLGSDREDGAAPALLGASCWPALEERSRPGRLLLGEGVPECLKPRGSWSPPPAGCCRLPILPRRTLSTCWAGWVQGRPAHCPAQPSRPGQWASLPRGRQEVHPGWGGVLHPQQAGGLWQQWREEQDAC